MIIHTASWRHLPHFSVFTRVLCSAELDLPTTQLELSALLELNLASRTGISVFVMIVFHCSGGK